MFGILLPKGTQISAVSEKYYILINIMSLHFMDMDSFPLDSTAFTVTQTWTLTTFVKHGRLQQIVSAK